MRRFKINLGRLESVRNKSTIMLLLCRITGTRENLAQNAYRIRRSGKVECISIISQAYKSHYQINSSTVVLINCFNNPIHIIPSLNAYNTYTHAMHTGPIALFLLKRLLLDDIFTHSFLRLILRSIGWFRGIIS